MDRPALKDAPFVPATHPAFGERETPKSVFADAARRRRAGAPPLRLVLHQRAALHRAGRGRPAGARDQADAVPHLGRLADRQRAHRRRRGRQAGRRPRRDQGPLRRAGQHRVGPHAGTGRRARGVRPRRAQDALQDLPRRPPGRLDHPALLPHRHRQLQPEDRAAVRGRRPAHRRTRDRRRPDRPVQLADRLLPQGRSTATSSSPRTACARGIIERIEARDRAQAGRARAPEFGSRSTRSSTSR